MWERKGGKGGGAAEGTGKGEMRWGNRKICRDWRGCGGMLGNDLESSAAGVRIIMTMIIIKSTRLRAS